MSMDEATRLIAVLRAGLSTELTREHYVEWAYGQAKLENSAITREMAELAADEKFGPTSA